VATGTCRGRRARLRFRTLIRWLWYFENSPVSPNEVLLRKIPNNRSYFSSEMGLWAVKPYSFQPHKNRDQDGMSFFREDFTSPLSLAQNKPPVDGVRITRIKASQLTTLGLDFFPDPSHDDLRGHVLVPAMRWTEKKLTSVQERNGVSDCSQKLAKIATNNGVLNPLGLPEPAKKQPEVAD
jgi:hypothetical protein